MGKHLDDDEINMNLNNCKLSGRWIILQGNILSPILKHQLSKTFHLKGCTTRLIICTGSSFQRRVTSSWSLPPSQDTLSCQSLSSHSSGFRTLISQPPLRRELKLWFILCRKNMTLNKTSRKLDINLSSPVSSSSMSRFSSRINLMTTQIWSLGR